MNYQIKVGTKVAIISAMALALLVQVLALTDVYAQGLQVIDVYVGGYDPYHDYDVCGGKTTDQAKYSCVSFRGSEFENYKGTFEYDLESGDRIFGCAFDITAGEHSCKYDIESSPMSIESILINMNNKTGLGLPPVLSNIGFQAMLDERRAEISSTSECIMLVMCHN